MNRATGSPSNKSIKLVVAASPLVDILDLMEKLSHYWAGSVLRDYKLGQLDALRLELPSFPNTTTSSVTLYALLGDAQYIALQEILLSNADGVLLIVDMNASQRDASIQNVLQTSQSLRRQGRDIRQLSLAFLYYRCELASSQTVDQWDQLLECERNNIPRFCTSSGEIDTTAQAIQTIVQDALEAAQGVSSDS